MAHLHVPNTYDQTGSVFLAKRFVADGAPHDEEPPSTVSRLAIVFVVYIHV